MNELYLLERAREWYEAMKAEDAHHFEAHFDSEYNEICAYTFEDFINSAMVKHGLAFFQKLLAEVKQS